MIVRFPYSSIAIPPEKILRVMGYEQVRPDKATEDALSRIMLEAEEYCDINCCYRVFDNVQYFNGVFYLDENELKVGKMIGGLLKKASSIAIFVVTAGEGFDNQSELAKIQDNPLSTYMLDILGAEIVEAASENLLLHLQEQFKTESLNISNKYSPGYCDWSLSDQHTIFSLLPVNEIGVSLTDSFMMQPVKSISGIIGIGKNIKKEDYLCDLCSFPDCLYRKT